MQQIHWYPGHMKKAQIDVQEKVKIVDLVIELLDARIPLSSRNPKLFELTKAKNRLVVLTKNDLADPAMTQRWIEYFIYIIFFIFFPVFVFPFGGMRRIKAFFFKRSFWVFYIQKKW